MAIYAKLSAKLDRLMQFDRFALEDALGAVLAHGIKAGDVVLRKGRLLSAERPRAPCSRRVCVCGGGPV